MDEHETTAAPVTRPDLTPEDPNDQEARMRLADLDLGGDLWDLFGEES